MYTLPLRSAARQAAGIRQFDTAEQLSASVWQFGWQFDRDDAVFAGHFPHEPILAGVFLLEMAQRAVEFAAQASMRPPRRLGRVERFRFLSPILPGDPCDLRVEWQEDGGVSPSKVKVAFSKRGQRVAHGLLSDATQNAPAPAGMVACPMPVDAPAGQSARAAQAMDLDALAILRMMPHRYPMLLVDRIETGQDASAVAFKNITFAERCYQDVDRAESADDLAYPLSLLVESFGQGAGLLLSRRGFLDKARSSCVVVFAEFERIELLGDAYPGDCLRHEVRLDYSGPQLAMLSGQTLVDGRVIAKFGSLKAFLVDKSNLERQAQHA